MLITKYINKMLFCGEQNTISSRSVFLLKQHIIIKIKSHNQNKVFILLYDSNKFLFFGQTCTNYFMECILMRNNSSTFVHHFSRRDHCSLINLLRWTLS